MKKIHTIESMKAEAREEADYCRNVKVLGKWLECKFGGDHGFLTDYSWYYGNTKISEDRAACLLDYLK